VGRGRGRPRHVRPRPGGGQWSRKGGRPSGWRAILPILLPAFLLSVALAACTAIVPPEPDDPIYDNPQDPEGNDYVAPETTITTGPAEGSTVGTSEVTLAWSGNRSGMLFQGRLNGSAWTPWSSATSIILRYLDEGDYTFEVRAGYPSGTAADPSDFDETPASRSFTVDAVHGSSLRLSPLVQQVDSDASFQVELIAEEVSDLMLVATILHFDAAHLRVLSLAEGPFLTSTGGSIASYNGFDNVAGTIEINMATATGSPPGITGSGVVLTITFQVKTAMESSVTFDAALTRLRDHINQAITIGSLVPTLVRTP
jgi:hypothetical protein